MSLLADALQPSIPRGLFSLIGRPGLNHLSATITSPPKYGYDLDADVALGLIHIDFREPSFITEVVGGDAARQASACFTSMAGVSEALDDPRSTAWALIRLYYASFYGGHSLLRLLGRSCTYFDQRHTVQIKSLLAARGTPLSFDLPSGLYNCTLNSAQTGFSMSQARGRVGGAHEAFWETFDDLLSGLTEAVLVGHLLEREAREVFVKLEAVRRIYRRGAGASWLSVIRNEIQYRQGLGVWQPLSVNKSQRAQLSRLADQWNRDPMGIDIDAPPVGDLFSFVLACAFTTATCRAILTRLKERSSDTPKSFAAAPLQLCT